MIYKNEQIPSEEAEKMIELPAWKEIAEIGAYKNPLFWNNETGELLFPPDEEGEWTFTKKT